MKRYLKYLLSLFALILIISGIPSTTIHAGVEGNGDGGGFYKDQYREFREFRDAQGNLIFYNYATGEYSYPRETPKTCLI